MRPQLLRIWPVLFCIACGGRSGSRLPAEPTHVPSVSAEERVAAEQAVLAFVLQEYGSGAAVNDSTWSHRCSSESDGYCRRPSIVTPSLWSSYLRTIRTSEAVRDLLAPAALVDFVSTLEERPETPCRERRRKIELSRVGVGHDGREAIVSYVVWLPMNHLGCGAVHGATILLRRTASGQWARAAILSTVVS
jgi:hypothetical protein